MKIIIEDYKQLINIVSDFVNLDTEKLINFDNSSYTKNLNIESVEKLINITENLKNFFLEEAEVTYNLGKIITSLNIKILEAKNLNSTKKSITPFDCVLDKQEKKINKQTEEQEENLHKRKIFTNETYNQSDNNYFNVEQDKTQKKLKPKQSFKEVVDKVEEALFNSKIDKDNLFSLLCAPSPLTPSPLLSPAKNTFNIINTFHKDLKNEIFDPTINEVQQNLSKQSDQNFEMPIKCKMPIKIAENNMYFKKTVRFNSNINKSFINILNILSLNLEEIILDLNKAFYKNKQKNKSDEKSFTTLKLSLNNLLIYLKKTNNKYENDKEFNIKDFKIKYYEPIMKNKIIQYIKLNKNIIENSSILDCFNIKSEFNILINMLNIILDTSKINLDMLYNKNLYDLQYIQNINIKIKEKFLSNIRDDSNKKENKKIKNNNNKKEIKIKSEKLEMFSKQLEDSIKFYNEIIQRDKNSKLNSPKKVEESCIINADHNMIKNQEYCKDPKERLLKLLELNETSLQDETSHQLEKLSQDNIYNINSGL
ncbi:MAG: hypothetical protein U1E31_00590 [Rickettsiales bacterium]